MGDDSSYFAWKFFRNQFDGISCNWDIKGVPVDKRWKSIRGYCKRHNIKTVNENMSIEEARDCVWNHFNNLMNDSYT